MPMLIGIILGIFLCTVGVQGIAKFVDKGVEKTQEVIRENVK
jgi:hypothetical protein